MSDRDTLRIVLLADTHLGFDLPIRPRVQRRRRGPDFFENYRRVLDYAVQTGADLVVHGGDLFFRSRVPEKIVDLAYEPLVACASEGVPIVIVPGNHERSFLPSSLYLAHPGIHVFDRPRTFRFEIAGVALALSGFPFVRDIRTRFPGVLRETGWDDRPAEIRFLCLHQAVEGAKVGPAGYVFRRGRDVVRIRDVPADFDAVLAGHIHRRQVLTGDLRGREVATPVVYPGSVERTSFAERSEPKGFFEIELRRGEGSWGIGRLEFRPLPARDMVDLHLDPGISAANLETWLRAAIAPLEPDSVVRLRCRGAVSDDVREKLSPERLRAVFPERMNVQCGRELLPRRPGEPTRVRSRAERLVRSIEEKVPTGSGVYVFRGHGRCLYVGKSVNLRRRMLEHLRSDRNDPRTQMRRMAYEIEEFSFTETATELLALLLEDQTIKREHSEYNTRQREYLKNRYLCLTDVTYPNLRTVTRSDDAPAGRVFGPFRDEHLTEGLKRIAEDVLHLRACADVHPRRKSVRFDLEQCTGPCRGKVSERDYARIVERVSAFLDGDSSFVVEELTKRMEASAAAREYEGAAELSRRVSFCRRFCARQGFLRDFREHVLFIREESGQPPYVFDRGRLVQWNGIPWTTGAEPEEDARFILDRGHVVYGWILRHREQCAFRFEPPLAQGLPAAPESGAACPAGAS